MHGPADRWAEELADLALTDQPGVHLRALARLATLGVHGTVNGWAVTV